MRKLQFSAAKYVATLAVFSAIATVLMALEFPMAAIMPPFLEMDFSEAPALIASFTLGPSGGVVVCLIKNLLHLPLSSTSCVGELSNFLIGAAFVFPAGLIFKYRKKFSGALIGCAVGTVCMAAIALPVNYYLTYPLFAKILVPMDAIMGMYAALYPSVGSLWRALLIFNTPFNLMKALVCTIVGLLLYKRLGLLIDSFAQNAKKIMPAPRKPACAAPPTAPPTEAEAAADRDHTPSQ